MDIDITCIKAFEYLNDRIDGQLDPSFENTLSAHLSKCRACRIEHSLTLGARASVRQHLKRVSTPAPLRNKIRASFAPGSGAATRPATGLAGMLGITGWRIPLAFGGALAIALLALLVLTNKPGHNHTKPSDGSVVTESFNHFDEVLDGRLKPDIRSENPLVVQKYFEERVHFPVRMLPMREFQLVGGQLTTADNETTAHFIYQRDGEMFYISQSDARSLFNNRRHFIPAPVLAALTASGVYTTTGKLTDCSMAMWLVDSTLCTAIADITPDLLMANIAEVDVP